jgi:hypothetical protein
MDKNLLVLILSWLTNGNESKPRAVIEPLDRSGQTLHEDSVLNRHIGIATGDIGIRVGGGGRRNGNRSGVDDSFNWLIRHITY